MRVKLAAFDMDGTLTQSKTPMPESTAKVLDALKERYELLIISAGTCERVRKQTLNYPINVLGNYGMYYMPYGDAPVRTGQARLALSYDEALKRATALRREFGYTDFAGDSIIFDSESIMILPLLGADASEREKRAFDPDRRKRIGMIDAVRRAFPECNAYLGGANSFDIIPKPFSKLRALDDYLSARGLSRAQAAYAGDDYMHGGSDEGISESGVTFIKVDDFRRLDECVKPLM